MPTRPKLLSFAASNSGRSINKRLAIHAAQVLQSEITPNVVIEIIDLNDFEMPIYSSDREKTDGIPAQAQAFYDALGAADGIIISFAEHNGSYSAAFKNIFDWASRIDRKIYQNKPMVVLSTSPGKGGGRNVLKTAVEATPHFGGNIKGSLSVGPFGEQFDIESGQLTHPDSVSALHEALVALHNAMSGST